MTKGKEPIYSIEDVDPQIAERWLETNHDNRSIAEKRVDEYAKVMAAGGWFLNGDTIKFDTNRQLIDGQHRLWAVVRAKCTIRLSIARNVAPEAAKSIDRGRPRSIGEALRREKVVPQPNRVAMWAAATYLLTTGDTRQNSVEWTEAYYNDNRVHVEKMLKLVPTKGVLKLAAVGAALVFARPKAPAKVDAFVESLVSGENLESNSPVYALRELLIHSVGQRSKSTRVYGIKTLRALQAYLEDETIANKKLYATEGALNYFRGRR